MILFTADWHIKLGQKNQRFGIRAYWFKTFPLVDGKVYIHENIHFHSYPEDHDIAKVPRIPFTPGYVGPKSFGNDSYPVQGAKESDHVINSNREKYEPCC